MSGRAASGLLLLLTGLSLLIGWGIRGNYGHEFGAMIPGALAAMAGVLLAGRADWHRRIAFFACFGAIGWSFGGSMSYMQVIAYTHSGHAPSVLYGYVCLWVIGFLWGFLGAAGTALPAFLERERLIRLLGPMTAVFLLWQGQDLLLGLWSRGDGAYRQNDPWYWYDSDWVAAWLATALGVAWAGARRKFDAGSSLVLHLGAGWLAGFLLFPNLLGWRMTPPRGDNWSGCLGMAIGLALWLRRERLPGVLLAALVGGSVGGAGFAGAQALKLAGIATGWQTNWHSVLEQTYGAVNGLGIGLAFLLLARRAPAVRDTPPVRRWAEVYAVAFVLLAVTYVNLRKNPLDWVKAKAVPAALYGLPVGDWFALGYLFLAACVLGLLALHLRRRLAVVPADWFGKGQLFYIVFLWWMVLGNFDRAVVAFAPMRLITEGVIHVNAVLCTLLILALRPPTVPAPDNAARFDAWCRRAGLGGLSLAGLIVLAAWGFTRQLYGDAQAPGASRHVRFGSGRTATTAPPAAGQPHP